MAGANLLMAKRPYPKREEHEAGVPAWILRVRRLMADRGWTSRELSRQSGLSPGWVSTTITQVKRGQQPRRETLARMAQTFNEPVGLWLKLGGLAAEDHEWHSERMTFAEFVDTDPALTEQQRETLKQVYVSYVSSVDPPDAPSRRRRKAN